MENALFVTILDCVFLWGLGQRLLKCIGQNFEQLYQTNVISVPLYY